VVLEDQHRLRRVYGSENSSCLREFYIIFKYMKEFIPSQNLRET
jgi:hypothetical protein